MKGAYLILILMILPVVSALELNVTQIDVATTIIKELGNPAYADLRVFNHNGREKVELYSYVELEFVEPSDSLYLDEGYQDVRTKFVLGENLLSTDGFLKAQYFFLGEQENYEGRLLVKIVEAEEALNFQEVNLAVSDEKAKVVIENVANTKIEDGKIFLKSAFFDETFDFSIEPFERKEFFVGIDRDDSSDLAAGSYILSGAVGYRDKIAKTDGLINYLPTESVSVYSEEEGFVIVDRKEERKNEGNTKALGRIVVSKNLVSRLFTTFSVEPTYVERNVFDVKYTWERVLEPQDSLSVELKTNYTIPFIVLILLFLLVGGLYLYNRTSVLVQKKVSFVKTTGGEFALRVNLRVKARKNVQDVTVSDHLPTMTKLYEKFGIRPDVIDEKSRKISWKISSLNSGEQRFYSYVLYSKFQTLGKFELPSAFASFKINGKHESVRSNKSFFVAETVRS